MADRAFESPDHVTLEVAVSAVAQVVLAKYETPVEVVAETRFQDIGLDSVDYAVGFILLEDLMGMELDPESAVDLECVADLTRIRVASRIAYPSAE